MWNASILSPKHLSPAVATMMIVLGTIGSGLVPLFAKTLTNAGLASPAIAFYRYLWVALLLLPALTFTSKKGETGQRVATFFLGQSVGGWQEALAGLPILRH